MAKILIIEPNVEISRDVELILKTQNHETKVTNSPEEAFSVLDSFTPELILSETKFDGLTGFDFLKFKQQDKNLFNVPFIFVSIKSNSQIIREAMNMGADDFLTKPFTANDLLLAVKARLLKYSEQHFTQESNKMNNQ